MNDHLANSQEAALQYNEVAVHCDIERLRGLVMNPEDFRRLDKRQEIERTANKNDKIKTRLLGHPVSSSSAMAPGHILWIDEDYKVLACTDQSGIIKEE